MRHQANLDVCCLPAGKAIAETVNEKVGAALGEILSEITKANAERDYAWRCVRLTLCNH